MEPGANIEGAAVPAPVDILDHPDAGARVIRGGAIRGVVYVTTILLTAAAVPLMTRHLGVADFGQFVTASSIVMIVAGVTEFGLSAIGMREYALASRAQRRALIANLLGLRTALTVAGLAVAALLMALAGYPQVVVLGMLVSGAGLVLLNMQQTYSISLTAELSWGAFSAFELINSVVVAAGTALLVLIGVSLFPFFYVSVASSAAALLACAVYLRHQVSLLPLFELGEWRRLARDTLPFAVAATVGILYPRVGLIVVSLISDANQTGYYSTAFKVVEVVGGTSGLIASSAFPIFARAGRDDHERLRYAAAKVSDTAVIAGTYITLSLVIAAPFVIAVVGGGAFKAAVPVLRIQAVALLGGFLAATLGYTLLSLRMHGALLRVTLAALLVSIVLSLALVPSLGANGASIASAVCEFVVAAGYMLALARSHVRLRLHVTVLLRVAFAGAVAVGVLVLPLPSIVLWMIGSVVYVGLLLALRAFPSELRHILPGGDRARAMAVKRR
ncbi:MAG TPA: oligosaccharide flippase family protein [Solirubrobacteraceae bacterium]|jgi:O-antigen/teichoic acid export membrane protein|nr:oligosaccharide flippase family protein [Solirubrobacteraceae bacterium]